MIQATDIELRAGSELLLTTALLRVDSGDRIGLVGRNGAGKTTLTKALAGETQPTGGSISTTGSVGYLPQDPRSADPEQLAKDRILSARGLDRVLAKMTDASVAMSQPDISSDEFDRQGSRYNRFLTEFEALGGYAVESEAATIAASIGLADRILDQPLGTLSGGQRRRVELARILFSGADVLLLDEPTNHLDADSIKWLRKYLSNYAGGFIVISHDTELLADTVNKVWHLDANRQEIDQYAMSWEKYLQAREVDERRRKRERRNAEQQADSLRKQAEKMRAKATKAKAAQNMFKRADKLLAETSVAQQKDAVAKLRFPTPKACGRVPLTASGLSRSYGSLEVFTDVDLAIDRGSKVVILGLNGAGKTTMLRILAGIDAPDTGTRELGHGAVIGYYAQEHETLNPSATVWETMASAGSHLNDTAQRTVLGSFLFQGDSVHKLTGVLSGGEKTRLALACLVVSGANVLLLDEPTNNLDPASRAEVLNALSLYEGAVVLVTHDPGAVFALNPERVLILPDGDEDLWNDSYAELVELA
ncbi:MAG: ATP-binding cassette domain-containing protein [Candidatus Nanopelagicales bacterium]|nr:ATP-binding cassette domain-containing protein [Candidatus Nanopelagicales bacterium]MCF8538735.1 ATP-binding cassette domain-containing protein [Candidatus Nanopelagicales bacterium]MCF8550801.1 ATP-binding cassette domain-containing protein [Candidatus Nanopelagicales bacterium]